MVERQRMHKRKREGQDPSLNVIGKRARISKPFRTSMDDAHIIHNDMSIARPFPANNGSVQSVIDSVGVKIGHTKSDLPHTFVPLTGEDKTQLQQLCRIHDEHNLLILDDLSSDELSVLCQLEIKPFNSNQHELIEAHSEWSSAELDYPSSDETKPLDGNVGIVIST